MSRLGPTATRPKCTPKASGHLLEASGPSQDAICCILGAQGARQNRKVDAIYVTSEHAVFLQALAAILPKRIARKSTCAKTLQLTCQICKRGAFDMESPRPDTATFSNHDGTVASFGPSWADRHEAQMHSEGLGAPLGALRTARNDSRQRSGGLLEDFCEKCKNHKNC